MLGQPLGAAPTGPGPSFAMWDLEHAQGPEGTASFTHSDMEVPYTEGFAWPFEMTGETAGNTPNGRRGSRPQAVSHPLTQRDIAAFMRINPGDEPFL